MSHNRRRTRERRIQVRITGRAGPVGPGVGATLPASYRCRAGLRNMTISRSSSSDLRRLTAGRDGTNPRPEFPLLDGIDARSASLIHIRVISGVSCSIRARAASSPGGWRRDAQRQGEAAGTAARKPGLAREPDHSSDGCVQPVRCLTAKRSAGGGGMRRSGKVGSTAAGRGCRFRCERSRRQQGQPKPQAMLR